MTWVSKIEMCTAHMNLLSCLVSSLRCTLMHTLCLSSLVIPQKPLAYAMLDYKEFFAEMSVTYLCDYYDNLDLQDRAGMSMEACCPPLIEPNTATRVIEQYSNRNTNLENNNNLMDDRETYDNSTNNDNKEEEGGFENHFWFNIAEEDGHDQSRHRSRIGCCRLWFLPRSTRQPYQHSNSIPPNFSSRMIDPIFQEIALHRNCLDVKHCNKFYPFTRKQLQYHDPDTFNIIKRVWNDDIAEWVDRNDQRLCSRPIKWILNLLNMLP